MQSFLISGVTKDEFLTALREIVREELQNTDGNSELLCEFISVKELQKLFKPQISRVTIDAWSNKGLLKKHWIGGRVYFLKSEVVDSITSLKKYSSTN